MVDIISKASLLTCPDSDAGGSNEDMTNKSNLLDDIAKVAGGAAGTLNSVREQIKNDVKARVEEVAMRLDLVPREDLDRVEALLEKAISDQKEMALRLDALEKTAEKKKK